MNALIRFLRSLRIAYSGAYIYGVYKVPEWTRRLLRRGPPDDLTKTHERAAREILACTLSLRGVIIKVSQVIATRSDVFPPPYIEILKQCHDAVPTVGFDVIRGAVEGELGRPLEEVFEDTLRVHVHHLRHKIEANPKRPQYVVTVRGEGYSFTKK